MWICPANERQCYNVTQSLIGWAHSQNDPCILGQTRPADLPLIIFSFKVFLGVSLGLLTQTRTADLAVSLTFSPWFTINVLLLLCDAFKLRSNKIRLVPVTCLNIQCKFMCDRMPDWCCSVGCFVNQSRASEAVMNLYLNLLRIQNCAYSRCCVSGFRSDCLVLEQESYQQ